VSLLHLNPLEQLQAQLAASETEREQLRRHLDETKQQLSEAECELLDFEYQLALLRRRIFGRSSEKLSAIDVLRGRLFNEAEEVVEGAVQDEERSPSDTVGATRHARRRGGANPLFVTESTSPTWSKL